MPRQTATIPPDYCVFIVDNNNNNGERLRISTDKQQRSNIATCNQCLLIEKSVTQPAYYNLLFEYLPEIDKLEFPIGFVPQTDSVEHRKENRLHFPDMVHPVFYLLLHSTNQVCPILQIKQFLPN